MRDLDIKDGTRIKITRKIELDVSAAITMHPVFFTFPSDMSSASKVRVAVAMGTSNFRDISNAIFSEVWVKQNYIKQ